MGGERQSEAGQRWPQGSPRFVLSEDTGGTSRFQGAKSTYVYDRAWCHAITFATSTRRIAVEICAMLNAGRWDEARRRVAKLKYQREHQAAARAAQPSKPS